MRWGLHQSKHCWHIPFWIVSWLCRWWLSGKVNIRRNSSEESQSLTSCFRHFGDYLVPWQVVIQGQTKKVHVVSFFKSDTEEVKWWMVAISISAVENGSGFTFGSTKQDIPCLGPCLYLGWVLIEGCSSRKSILTKFDKGHNGGIACIYALWNQVYIRASSKYALMSLATWYRTDCRSEEGFGGFLTIYPGGP